MNDKPALCAVLSADETLQKRTSQCAAVLSSPCMRGSFCYPSPVRCN